MSEHWKDRISRRAALTKTALAFGLAAAATVCRQAVAQQKITQQAANYQNKPNGEDRCGVCSNFQPPNACKFVQGDISPSGWCQLFSAKSSS